MDRSFTQNKEIPKVGQTCGDRCPVTCSQHSSRYTGMFFIRLNFVGAPKHPKILCQNQHDMLKRLKSFKLAETVVESTKLSTSTSELKKEIIKNSFSPIPPEKSSKSSKSKYASFFNDKEVKMEGIFPLPKKRVMKPRWNSKACFQIVVADSLSDWLRASKLIGRERHLESIIFKTHLSQIFQKCFSKQKKISVHTISSMFEIHTSFVRTWIKLTYWL